MNLLEKCPKSPTTKHVAFITKDNDEICCKHCGKVLDPLLNVEPFLPREAESDDD